MTDLRDTIVKLKAWFPREAHDERDLPGGGKWFYVRWQLIRERLDEACPGWEVYYSAPTYLGDYCTITCTIAIGGVSKQGVGNAEILLLSSSGKNMARGTPIERATADAFKNAAEAWGVARYLDEQTDPKAKADFVRYMQRSGDGRAADFHHQNEGNYQKPNQPKKQGKAQPFAQQRSLTVVPPPVPQSANSTNLDRLRAFVKALGATPIAGDEMIKTALTQRYAGRTTNQLNAAEVEAVRDAVLVSYARSLVPQSVADATLFEWFLALPPGLSDRDLARSWLEVIQEKMQDDKS